ncbi:hypothetical protein C8J56DRAFT_890055 [Mycena floridula]|nr:hypothetical protein C8J56DRAFT_890055 [Mycena floridula]
MPSDAPSTNGAPAKSTRKSLTDSVTASTTKNIKPVKPSMRAKSSAKQDEALYFSSNKAQQTNQDLVGNRGTFHPHYCRDLYGGNHPGCVTVWTSPMVSNRPVVMRYIANFRQQWLSDRPCQELSLSSFWVLFWTDPTLATTPALCVMLPILGNIFRPGYALLLPPYRSRQYVFIVDNPAQAIPSTTRKKEGEKEEIAAIPIAVPDMPARPRREDYDPYEPVGGNNPYYSEGDDQGEIEGFDLRDLGYNDREDRLDPPTGWDLSLGESQDEGRDGQETGPAQADKGSQASTGLLADVSRKLGQRNADLALQGVAVGTGSGKAGLSSRKKPSDKVALESGQAPRQKTTGTSSAKSSRESKLQEKQGESSLWEEQQTAKKVKAKAYHGWTARSSAIRITGNTFTHCHPPSVPARSEIAALKPSLMPKEKEGTGVSKKVSKWSFPLPPTTTKDIPVKPFSKAFLGVPFPVLHQGPAAGSSGRESGGGPEGKRGPKERSEGGNAVLKSLKFLKKLADIPEDSEHTPAVGSQVMKAVQGMFAGYQPNGFTEKSAKEAIQAAKGKQEQVVIVSGYNASGKRPRQPASPSSSSSLGRIPAREKGKTKAVYSSSSSGSGQSRRFEKEHSQKENTDSEGPRSSKRRKSISSTLGESGRVVLSPRQENSVSSTNVSGRLRMDFTPERYQLFKDWETARRQSDQEEQTQKEERQLQRVVRHQEGDEKAHEGLKKSSPKNKSHSPASRGGQKPTDKESKTENRGRRELRSTSRRRGCLGSQEVSPSRGCTATRGRSHQRSRSSENPTEESELAQSDDGMSCSHSRSTRRNRPDQDHSRSRQGRRRGHSTSDDERSGFKRSKTGSFRDVQHVQPQQKLLARGLIPNIGHLLAQVDALGAAPIPILDLGSVQGRIPILHLVRESARLRIIVRLIHQPMVQEALELYQFQSLWNGFKNRWTDKGWTGYIPLGAVTNERCEKGLSEKMKQSGEMVGKLENGWLTFKTATQETRSTYLSYEDFFPASENFVQTIETCYIPKGEKKAGGKWVMKVAQRHRMFFNWLKAQPQLKAKWVVYWGYISKRMHHDAVDRTNRICKIDVVFPEILQEVRESLQDRKINAAASASQNPSNHST